MKPRWIEVNDRMQQGYGYLWPRPPVTTSMPISVRN